MNTRFWFTVSYSIAKIIAGTLLISFSSYAFGSLLVSLSMTLVGKLASPIVTSSVYAEGGLTAISGGVLYLAIHFTQQYFNELKSFLITYFS